MPHRKHFASDNYSGVCPEVWAALQAANPDHVPGYGDDPITAKAQALFRDLFEHDCDVHFVFNGTAANSLVIAAACDSFEGVVCHAYSHIETDESNAPGLFCSGVKTLPVAGDHGKLTTSAVERVFHHRRDIHASAPKVLSLTQSTELGTVYNPDETSALTSLAHRLGMVVHVDGARFSNALVSLGVTPAQASWKAGVDALCFGGTKNGMLGSEAVVFFNPSLAQAFKRRCKQSGQLASKMRFQAAQWIGLLETGAWKRNAGQANAMAVRLEAAIRTVPGVQVLYPRQANAVFVAMPTSMSEGLLAQGWRFYTDVGPGGARLMCSWNTEPGEVDEFVSDARLLAE